MTSGRKYCINILESRLTFHSHGSIIATPATWQGLPEKKYMTCKGHILSPTQRTIRALKDQGRMCGIVERFIQNPIPGKHGLRSDLFGFIDVVATCPRDGIIGIQCCGADVAAHFKKITEQRADNAVEWLRAGGKIEIWGWRKVKLKRGGVKMVFRPKVIEITMRDFADELP